MRHLIKTLFTVTLILFSIISYSQTVTNGADSGNGSLRQAIENATAGSNVIIISSVSEIGLKSELSISKSLTIVKEGSSRVKINRLFNGALLKIQNATVNLENLNIANGNTINGGGINLDNATVNVSNCLFENNVASGSAGKGGAIYIGNNSRANVANSDFEKNWSNSAGGAIYVASSVENALNITDCYFENNRTAQEIISATPGSGGAIHIESSTIVNISDCKFLDNTAAGEGGAIYHRTNTLNIRRCSFENNTAESEFGTRGGSAIMVAGGSANIEKSDFIENNTIGNATGGTISVASSASLSLMTSTLSGNTTTGKGGGIYTESGNALINACTISENTASSGGGIASNFATLKNSIVSNNTGGSTSDVEGTLFSDGYNIISSNPGSAFDAAATDLLSTDPELYSLANNGGSTSSYKIDSDSPAFNAGAPSDNFTDQLDQAVVNGRRDIGAYESQEIINSVVETDNLQIKLYPNPAADQINLQIDNFDSDIQFYIYDLKSQLLKTGTNKSGGRIDISTLNSGVYLFSLEYDSKVFQIPFIKS